MRLLLISCVFLALVACQKPAQQVANGPTPAAEVGPHKGVDRSHKGQTAPNVLLDDGSKIKMPLAGEHPTPVLVNLWATWCAPCVKELPTLDRLSQSQLAIQKLNPEKGIVIMAVNQDSAPQASVDAFLKQHKIGRFAAFYDPKMALSGALGPDTVLPTSILYDANGKEVWRYVGDLDWTSPEAAKLLAEATGGGRG